MDDDVNYKITGMSHVVAPAILPLSGLPGPYPAPT
jgi:hypothetical protein